MYGISLSKSFKIIWPLGLSLFIRILIVWQRCFMGQLQHCGLKLQWQQRNQMIVKV